MIMFSHKGNIVKIYELSYFASDPTSTDSIHHVRKIVIPYKYVRLGLVKYFSLMGTFAIPPPNVPRTISNINMITSSTMPFDDTWNVSLESELDSYGGEMPLSPYESEYVAIQSCY